MNISDFTFTASSSSDAAASARRIVPLLVTLAHKVSRLSSTFPGLRDFLIETTGFTVFALPNLVHL